MEQKLDLYADYLISNTGQTSALGFNKISRGYFENSEVIFNKQLVKQGVFTDDFYYKNSIENFKKNNEIVDESKVLFLETALFMGYHNDTKSVNVELSKFYFLYLTTIGLSITLFEILLFNSYFIVLVLFFITLRFLYKLL